MYCTTVEYAPASYNHTHTHTYIHTHTHTYTQALLHQCLKSLCQHLVTRISSVPFATWRRCWVLWNALIGTYVYIYIYIYIYISVCIYICVCVYVCVCVCVWPFATSRRCWVLWNALTGTCCIVCLCIFICLCIHTAHMYMHVECSAIRDVEAMLSAVKRTVTWLVGVFAYVCVYIQDICTCMPSDVQCNALIGTPLYCLFV